MYESIQYCVSDSRIADIFMPLLYGKLSGNDCGSDAMSILNDLQEIPSFLSVHRRKADVIKDEDFGFQEFFHNLWI